MRGVVHVRARMRLTALRYELNEWQQHVAQAVCFFLPSPLVALCLWFLLGPE